MLERLDRIAVELERRLSKRELSGKTVTLKIKYSDFNLQTRSKTLPKFISSHGDILKEAKSLLYQEKLQNSVRLLGISLSNLNTEEDAVKEDDSVSVQLQFDF